MKKRHAIILTLTLLLAVPVLVISAALAIYKFQHGRNPNVPTVVALPADHAHPANMPSYQGPHPSQRKWLDDPFPWPILPGQTGPVTPVNAGPLQYPFACMSEESGLGPPLPDNVSGVGTLVPGGDGQAVGFSKDCSIATQVQYYYRRSADKQFVSHDPGVANTDSIRLQGRDVPFVVRVETGTINRYVYLIMMLAGSADRPASPDTAHWNHKAVYQFRGGVGIGRRQGRIAIDRMLERRAEALSQGYAVLYSTANQTSNHYDVELAWDTALRVKRQFESLYGVPHYTVGVGGSGGAIQQYLISQNYPGLLDGGIALYSYPDMITQTIYTLDCELLEYYFDRVIGAEPLWQKHANRRWIEGLNASDTVTPRFAPLYAIASLLRGELPDWGQGATECAHAWRGMTPLVNNPRYVHFASRFSEAVLNDVHWTYWENLRRFFGTDALGFARQTWDNVGVQYGLQALRDGKLSPDGFLHLNASIGGWKKPQHMQPERYWIREGAASSIRGLSPWSHHNARHGQGEQTPARRTEGDLIAIEAAYRAGQIFVGQLQFPVLDLRHYLDASLDMHHSSASLSARARIVAATGGSDNHIIWMTAKPHTPVGQALAAMEQWLLLRENDPTAARPADIQDACFNGQGTLIASGASVWDGAWNGRPKGECLRTYPAFGTSRTVAGGQLAGDTFKCHLQSVNAAMASGVYAGIDMRPFKQRLERIFPGGVCDYSKGDAGRPANLFKK